MAAQAAIFVSMKKETIITVACILFVGAFAYFGLPMFIPRMENPSQQPFWETSLSESKDMQAFGLTLNHSTLQDAIDTFGNRVSLTLYETKSGDQVEGYFRETQVGPFLGRMAFTLVNNPADIQTAKEKSVAEQAPMSGNKSYKLASNLNELFLDEPVFSLAFIPTHVVLTADDVKGRFGEPDQIIEEMIESKKTGTVHYLYPNKGIDVTLDKEKRSIIQYISPKYFGEKIISPIAVEN